MRGTKTARLAASLAVVALLGAACGSATPSRPAAGRSTSTTSPARSTPTSTTPTTVAASTTTTVAPPGGGPVPTGFDPVSFSAISARTYWLLGTAPCANPVCTSLVRTTDGGAHFVGIPAPQAPIVLGSSAGASGVNTLRFADPLDGFAYARDTAAGSTVWVTHDGGVHWAKGIGDVLAFTLGGGTAYALSGTCANGSCTGLTLRHGPAASSTWSSTPLPVASALPGISLSAHGSSVWLSLTPGGAPSARSQTLLHSSDAGAHLAEETSPCVPALPGTVHAASSSVLWAICPTGTEAGAWRSTDAGAHWSALDVRHGLSGSGAVPGLANSARIAPASATTAVLSPGPNGELIRTTDAGASFHVVVPASATTATWTWIGFTTPSVGSALLSTPDTSAHPLHATTVPSEQLWRTTDGGAHWKGPVHIG